MPTKLSWQGEITAVQPRIRLIRSFDQRHHNYLGYALAVRGTVAAEAREFSVGIGKAAQEKHKFRVGDHIGGAAVPVADAKLEAVDFYKASGIVVLKRAPHSPAAGPPWHDLPPTLEVYRSRGHRRLDARTYTAKCRSCIWGCRMPVEMFIDQWDSEQRAYRFETFCYGPKSCSFYKAGATRKVPGRNGMQWEEEDWVDEEATAHRGPDD